MKYMYTLGDQTLYKIITFYVRWSNRRIPMSEIPSSEVDLDKYCHKLYQEKVSFILLFFTGLSPSCRINYCVNFMKREDLMVRSMYEKEDYAGRYCHMSMQCFGALYLCFPPAYWY